MDVKNARVQQYVAYWRNAVTNTWTELGVTRTGTPEFGGKGAYVNLEDADQFFGRVASEKVGWDVMCKITLLEVDYASLYGRLLAGQAEQVVDGANRALDFDTVPTNMTRDVAGELRLVPLRAAAGDLSEAITIWKTAPQIDLRLIGDRTKYQSIDVEFFAYPDPTRSRAGYPLSAGYFRIGDPNAVATNPTTIGYVAGNVPVAPYISTPAASLKQGDQKQFFAFGAWHADAAGKTMLVNNVGGYTASDTSIDYDSKAVSGEDYTGKYARIGTEIVYIVLDNMSSGVAGTLTVKRAARFTVAASMSDSDTITVQDDASLAVINITERAVHASSAPNIATIGNSASGSTPFGNKGLVSHVSAGSANMTATVGPTTSEQLIITAL